MLKSYGSFLHQVFDKKFSFDEITNNDSRRKDLEILANEIIDLYKDDPTAKDDEEDDMSNQEFDMSKLSVLDED